MSPLNSDWHLNNLHDYPALGLFTALTYGIVCVEVYKSDGSVRIDPQSYIIVRDNIHYPRSLIKITRPALQKLMPIIYGNYCWRYDGFNFFTMPTHTSLINGNDMMGTVYLVNTLCQTTFNSVQISERILSGEKKGLFYGVVSLHFDAVMLQEMDGLYLYSTAVNLKGGGTLTGGDYSHPMAARAMPQVKNPFFLMWITKFGQLRYWIFDIVSKETKVTNKSSSEQSAPHYMRPMYPDAAGTLQYSSLFEDNISASVGNYLPVGATSVRTSANVLNNPKLEITYILSFADFDRDMFRHVASLLESSVFYTMNYDAQSGGDFKFAPVFQECFLGKTTLKPVDDYQECGSVALDSNEETLEIVCNASFMDAV
jgi:hypothetical protein